MKDKDFIDKATPENVISAAKILRFDLKEFAEVLDATGPAYMKTDDLKAISESLVKAQLILEAIITEISGYINNR